MLDLGFYKENTWIPPEIDIADIVREYTEKMDFSDIRYYDDSSFDALIITQITPYIDAVYVKLRLPEMSDVEIIDHRHFVFKQDYMWSNEDESLFIEKCRDNEKCAFSTDDMDKIFEEYSVRHPEWHLQRYFTRSVRMLDHIYNCIKRNTVREMLYKSGLDELAVRTDSIDEINMFSDRPSDIYDGLSIRTLRALNCPDGAVLLAKHEYRQFLMELQTKAPMVFDEKMNDAQCRYIKRLIDGALTVGEASRLYLARRADLRAVWCHSLYEVFLQKESQYEQLKQQLEELGKIDSIYTRYISAPVMSEENADDRIPIISYYLLAQREEYDYKVRLSNRKRNPEWQERDRGYVVRYPQTINDFCREAVYMSNCLLAYVEALINNDTTILLMRKPDAVNDPFITIEIFGGELKQAYHRFNEDCTYEEIVWIEQYCLRHGIGRGTFKFNIEEDMLF